MNIKKFLHKIAQMADFQTPVEPVVEQPQPIPQEEPVLQGVPQLGPQAPEMAPVMIQTDVAEWKPSRGRNKGTAYYYLQLMNVPSGPISEHFKVLGYKFNNKFNVWSKQVKHDNVLGVEAELNEVSQQFNTPISMDAIAKLQDIFGFSGDTSTEIGGDDAASDIQKIKFMDVEDKEKFAIAKDVVRQKLVEIVDNIATPETQAFLDQLTSLNNKFYKYSRLNSMLIAWQNAGIDPTSGKAVPRSGTVSSLGAWDKKFGRKIKDEEVGKGMDIFVPTGGGTKPVQPATMATLLNGISRFMGMNGGDAPLEGENIAKFLGFMKSLIANSKKDFGKGKIWKTNYDYMLSVINKNRDSIKTVNQLAGYLKGKLDSGEKDEYSAPLRFKIGPVYDMEQTEVIPGQEDKDPKAEMDRVEGMWLGQNNSPDERTISIRDLAMKAAGNGKIWKGKNITVGLDENTGRAGGRSTGEEIQISDKSVGERELYTLMHELAHSVLHFGDKRAMSTSEERETDAEGAAYVVMGHYGFTNSNERTYNYLANWTQKNKNAKDFIMTRFEPILEAANAIIAGIEQQKMEDYGSRTASNWYSRIVLSKISDTGEGIYIKYAHYSEPEQKGEGRGGPGQFGERRLDDWSSDHREEIAIMTAIVKRQDWTAFEQYRQKLLNHYESPYNQQIVNSIVSAATQGKI
jgi:hypothetical protein